MAGRLRKLKADLDRSARLIRRTKTDADTREPSEDASINFSTFKSDFNYVVTQLDGFDRAMAEYEEIVEQEFEDNVPEHIARCRTELQSTQDDFHAFMRKLDAEVIRLQFEDGRRRYTDQHIFQQNVSEERDPGFSTPLRRGTLPGEQRGEPGRGSPDLNPTAMRASFNDRMGQLPQTNRPPSPTLSVQTAVTHATQSMHGPIVPRVKLPMLSIPSFKGEPAKFKPFWCRFENAVGNNLQLSDSDKLSYLVMFLDGNPKAMIEGLDPTNENYAVATKILRDTYGNVNVAVEEIEAKLYGMESPRNTGESLRKFYCELESHLGSLKGLGRDVTSHHLVSVVLAKLPSIIVTNMERAKTPPVSWNVELLRDLLRTEVEIREASDRRCPKKEKDTTRFQFKPQASTTEALTGQDRRPHRPSHNNSRPDRQIQWNRRPRTCIFCDSRDHYSEDCGVLRSNRERWQKLESMGRCTVCLRFDHRKQHCTSDKPCNHCHRVREHNRALCPARRGADSRGGRRANDNAHFGGDSTGPIRDARAITSEDQDASFCRLGGTEIVNLADDEQTILKTALVNVSDPEGRNNEEVRLFLDSGCSRSYITENLAKRLRLKTESSRVLTVNRFGGGDDGKHTMEVKTAHITLSTIYGRRYQIKVAVMKGDIMNRMTKFALSKKTLDQIPKRFILADKPFAQSREVDIEVLIGNDYYDDFVTGKRIELAPGFRLMDSEFGWILSGRVQDGHESMHDIVALYAQEVAQINVTDEMTVEHSTGEGKTSSIEDMWNLESLGITDDPNPVSDDAALETFNKTVKFEDDRYQVTWPWRANAGELPSNYAVAKRRLESTVNRIKRTPGLMERYDAVIRDQLKKSVIEETQEETPNRVHYLPHREVLTPDKETTKLRIVYDASARAAPDKPSLNDCLHRGLVFMTALVCLLMRFMLAPFMVISDIEKAFLQVGLQEQERDVTRFFWLRDITEPITPENLVIYRFTRVAFGMSPSSFLLGATIAHHLRKSSLDVARLIEENTYVDNIITGFRTEKEAIRFYYQSKALFKEASMNLREYASNSQEFRQSIPEIDRVSKTQLKVLGIGWDIEKDEVFLNVPKSFPEATTKRHVLQGLLKVYDPLGFVCPVVIRSRLLMQKLCQGSPKKWNAPLSENHVREYREIVAEYEKFRSLRWPRYFGHGIADEGRLMCFCDASQNAYATVIYFQHPKSDGCFSSRILFAKARVSPLKTRMTIPRMELMALLIGVRAVKFIREQLSFAGRVIVWSDSQCVLKWIASNRVYGTFVENRLREIRRVPNLEFLYVPTKENPADLPSRGVSFKELNQLWWKGPDWSLKSEESWPNVEVELQKSVVTEDQAADLESASGDIALVATPAPEPPFGIRSETYSSFGALLRVTAYCGRFLARVSKKPVPKEHFVSLEELGNAEALWMRYLQKVSFPDLIRSMETRKSHTTRDQLGTKFDGNGIIRCHGRMGLMEGSTDRKFPVLLPKEHHITRLIVEHVHRICLHGGRKITLNTLHRRYWIVRGAVTVRVPNLEFLYVPTKENPADLPSRGVSFKELNQLWWKGPDWSLKSEESWPNVEVELQKSVVTEDQAADLESASGDIALVATPAPEPPFGIRSETYSSFGALLRVTAYCGRFLARVSKKPVPKEHFVSLEELGNAEALWMRYLQKVSFPDLIRSMETRKSHTTRDQLGTKFDGNGIIRCHGRMGLMEGSTDRKFPVLLPKEHHITRLIVEHVHRICLHGGRKITLNTLHRRYWIVRGAVTVNRILRSCTVCQTVDGVGFARPEMPNLPWYRVNSSYPFEYTGIDYFGPLFVKGESKGVGSPPEANKVWICLATCLATRAMHLELVSSLSANDFLLALRRFVARRGKPAKIVCDNGSQFVHVAKYDFLSKSFDAEPIDWSFITPLSPWKGGVYERLVALVKNALKRSIGRSLLTKEQLATLLAEVEYTLNSRPLTKSTEEVSLSLTPNDLLGLRNLGDAAREPHQDEEDPSYNPGARDPSEALKALFRKTRNILNQFWSIWRTEYVDALRESHSLAHNDPKKSVRREPKVGEVVHVKDAKLPRNKWRLGIIQQVVKSQDGSAREVLLNQGKGSSIVRPVNLIILLEVTGEITSNQVQPNTTTTTATPDTTSTTTQTNIPTVSKVGPRPSTSVYNTTTVTTPKAREIRQAAVKAKEKIKVISNSELETSLPGVSEDLQKYDSEHANTPEARYSESR